MSEETATQPAIETAPSDNGKAPTLDQFMDELFGKDELADAAANRIAALLVMTDKLNGEMGRERRKLDQRCLSFGVDEKRGDVTEKIENVDYKFRSYKKVFEDFETAINEELDAAKRESDDHYLKVKGLVPDKVKKIRLREEQALDSQVQGRPVG